MTDKLIKYKGWGDIVVAVILAVRPSIIYESVPARVLSSFTGLVCPASIPMARS